MKRALALLLSVWMVAPPLMARERLSAGFVYSRTDDLAATPLEVLTELDFATHANWDVVPGFVDSGGNAVFSVPETLDEVDFATHVEWDVAGDFADSGGNCAYTDATNAGTCTQVQADLLNAATASGSYDFTYTIGSYTGDAACEITTAFALVAESLTMVDGVQTNTFTAAAVPGDFVISCTSTSGGFTIDDVTLKNNAQTSTLTHVEADFAAPAVGGVSYVFGYTISGFVTDAACNITTAFAASSTPLTMTNGAQTTTFFSAASPGNFVISCTSTITTAVVIFDDVTLKRTNSSGLKITIQQPATGSKRVNFRAAYVNCEVATVVTISVGGTAATITDDSASIVDVTQRGITPAFKAYHDSDVGAGTVTEIHDCGAGELLSVDLSSYAFDGGAATKNLSVGTDDVTGMVRMTVVAREEE